MTTPRRHHAWHHGSVTTERTEQVQCDGGSMDLHLWVPNEGESAPAILLIQEIFGVGDYIRAVARRLADAGYLVGAPDVFWRFHPNWRAGHGEVGLQESVGKVQQLE